MSASKFLFDLSIRIQINFDGRKSDSLMGAYAASLESDAMINLGSFSSKRDLTPEFKSFGHSFSKSFMDSINDSINYSVKSESRSRRRQSIIEKRGPLKEFPLATEEFIIENFADFIKGLDAFIENKEIELAQIKERLAELEKLARAERNAFLDQEREIQRKKFIEEWDKQRAMMDLPPEKRRGGFDEVFDHRVSPIFDPRSKGGAIALTSTEIKERNSHYREKYINERLASPAFGFGSFSLGMSHQGGFESEISELQMKALSLEREIKEFKTNQHKPEFHDELRDNLSTQVSAIDKKIKDEVAKQSALKRQKDLKIYYYQTAAASGGGILEIVAKGIISAVGNIPSVLNRIGDISSFINHTPQLESVSVASRLHSAADAVAPVLKPLTDVLPIVGIATSAVGIMNAIQFIAHIRGRREACLTLMTLLTVSCELRVSPRAFEGNTHFKSEMLDDLLLCDPMVTYARFIIYKYNPSCLDEIKSIVMNLAPSVLSMAASILTLTGVGSPVATVLSGISSAMAFGNVVCKSVKLKASTKAFTEAISKGQITFSNDEQQLMRGSRSTLHSIFQGTTMGDYLRFKIAQEFVKRKHQLYAYENGSFAFFSGEKTAEVLSSLSKAEFQKSSLPEKIRLYLTFAMWEIVKSDGVVAGAAKCKSVLNDLVKARTGSTIDEKAFELKLVAALIRTNR